MGLNIAVVTETYPPEVNGVAMTIGHLVDGLRGRGHTVRIVRPAQSGELPGRGQGTLSEDMLVRGFPLPRYPGLRFGWSSVRTLCQHWQKHRPDLVHVVTEGPLGWSAAKAARRLGIPATSGFHTHFDSYSTHYGLGWLRPLVAAALRMLHRQTCMTMVPTEALAAELAGAGLQGVRVVGRGVDTTRFDPARRSAALRAEWGVGPDDLVCLYVGRLAPEKNLSLVERSFAAIRQMEPRAQMVWVGHGPSYEQLKSAHPEQIFAGMREGGELAMHYASADLFIFASLTETYGNVVPEALASGLPVLAYRSAAAAELMVDGLHGTLVSPGDERAFIEAAGLLAARREHFPEIGRRTRTLMQSRGWDRVVQVFEHMLYEATGRRD